MDRNAKVYHSRAELVQSYRNLAGTLAKILAALELTIKPGLRTEQLDSMAQQLFVKYHVRSYFKGYTQYPAYISTSVNDAVVNTIPSARALAEGDLLSIQGWNVLTDDRQRAVQFSQIAIVGDTPDILTSER